MSKKPKNIPLKEAQDWVKRWRKKQGTYNKHHRIKGFLIPMDDLKAIMAEPEVANVRAYIGVEEKEDIKTKKKYSEEKLLLVGVRSDGTDIIYDSANGYVGADPTDDGIYDFTEPCPNTCDTSSPLFNTSNGG